MVKAFRNQRLHLLLNFPLWTSDMKGVQCSNSDSLCLLMFGCLFSLSLKCCLIIPIYDNRLLYRNNCTVTRRAESQSLLHALALSHACSFPLFWRFTRRVTATCWLANNVGCKTWWSRAREACQMVQKLMTEKRKRQIKNFLYWHRSEWGQDSTESWLDYGHYVVTTVPLLLQCRKQLSYIWKKLWHLYLS